MDGELKTPVPLPQNCVCREGSIRNAKSHFLRCQQSQKKEHENLAKKEEPDFPFLVGVKEVILSEGKSEKEKKQKLRTEFCVAMSASDCAQKEKRCERKEYSIHSDFDLCED